MLFKLEWGQLGTGWQVGKPQRWVLKKCYPLQMSGIQPQCPGCHGHVAYHTCLRRGHEVAGRQAGRQVVSIQEPGVPGAHQQEQPAPWMALPLPRAPLAPAPSLRALTYWWPVAPAGGESDHWGRNSSWCRPLGQLKVVTHRDLRAKSCEPQKP